MGLKVTREAVEVVFVNTILSFLRSFLPKVMHKNNLPSSFCLFSIFKCWSLSHKLIFWIKDYLTNQEDLHYNRSIWYSNHMSVFLPVTEKVGQAAELHTLNHMLPHGWHLQSQLCFILVICLHRCIWNYFKTQCWPVFKY